MIVIIGCGKREKLFVRLFGHVVFNVWMLVANSFLHRPEAAESTFREGFSVKKG